MVRSSTENAAGAERWNGLTTVISFASIAEGEVSVAKRMRLKHMPDVVHESLSRDVDRKKNGVFADLKDRCAFCGQLCRYLDCKSVQLVTPFDTRENGMVGEWIEYDIAYAKRCNECKKAGKRRTVWGQEVTDNVIHDDREEEEKLARAKARKRTHGTADVHASADSPEKIESDGRPDGSTIGGGNSTLSAILL